MENSMAALVIRNLPEALHHQLKVQAARHHRSMTREAIALLEQALSQSRDVREIPPPYKGKIVLTTDFIDNAKREGRT
jgi:hypothetical protein